MLKAVKKTKVIYVCETKVFLYLQSVVQTVNRRHEFYFARSNVNNLRFFAGRGQTLCLFVYSDQKQSGFP